MVPAHHGYQLAQLKKNSKNFQYFPKMIILGYFSFKQKWKTKLQKPSQPVKIKCSKILYWVTINYQHSKLKNT